MKLELNKEYLFKEEFCKQVIKERFVVYTRHREEFRLWLKQFFVYKFTNYSPLKIIIFDIIKEYENFPMYDISKRLQRRQEKEEMLQDYIINDIFKGTDEEIYLSYAKIARDFQFDKNEITDITVNTLAYNYVKDVLNKVADYIPPKEYVWRYTYEPLEADDVDAWIKILKKYFDKQDSLESMSAWEEAIQANDQGDYDTVKKVLDKQKENFYRKAQEEFEQEFRDFPVKTFKWKLKPQYVSK